MDQSSNRDTYAAYSADFSADSGAQQAREATRMPLIRTAKLIGRFAEFPCVMRDVSGIATRVKLYHPLPAGERVLVLELGTGERFEVEPIWEKDGHAGLSLLDPDEQFPSNATNGPYSKRAIRLAVEIPSQLRILGHESDVTIRDISHEGARIVTNHLLSMDQQLRLVVPALSEVYATVRWRRHPEYGLSFVETFRFEQLASVAAHIQSLARAWRRQGTEERPARAIG